MIKSKDYIAILEIAREIMPLLAPEITVYDEESIFDQFDEARKLFKVIKEEYSCYEVYPRHKLEKYYEYAQQLKEHLSTTAIKIKWLIDIDVVMDESNWSVYNDISQLARFYYQDIEITKLIEFK